jgi:class 3 adenylate cyclase
VHSALGELRALDFAPLLLDAGELAADLGVRGATEPVDVVETAARVILVTDIVGSTPLAHHLGDRRFVGLLRTHNQIVRRALTGHDGIEFKHTGDGIAAWFLDAASAIECALEIQEAVPASPGAAADFGVRIGVARGDVVMEGSDLFGLAVITAFRVCDNADTGGVLVAPDIPRLAAGIAEFESVGPVTLKGFSTAQELFVARRRATPDNAADGA